MGDEIRGNGGHVLRETTSRGRCELVCRARGSVRHEADFALQAHVECRAFELERFVMIDRCPIGFVAMVVGGWGAFDRCVPLGVCYLLGLLDRVSRETRTRRAVCVV